MQEHEIKALEDKLQYLKTELNKNVNDLELPAHTAVAGLPDELAQLITDNIKLKMRVAVLKRVRIASCGLRKERVRNFPFFKYSPDKFLLHVTFFFWSKLLYKFLILGGR